VVVVGTAGVFVLVAVGVVVAVDVTGVAVDGVPVVVTVGVAVPTGVAVTVGVDFVGVAVTVTVVGVLVGVLVAVTVTVGVVGVAVTVVGVGVGVVAVPVGVVVPVGVLVGVLVGVGVAVTVVGVGVGVVEPVVQCESCRWSRLSPVPLKVTYTLSWSMVAGIGPLESAAHEPSPFWVIVYVWPLTVSTTGAETPNAGASTQCAPLEQGKFSEPLPSQWIVLPDADARLTMISEIISPMSGTTAKTAVFLLCKCFVPPVVFFRSVQVSFDLLAGLPPLYIQHTP
jgi:hypothetical protein